MKKLILICTMFSTMMNYATDKTNTKSNAELMTSWQYKTTYMSNGKACYTEVDNYYFYSDNTCVKECNANKCNSSAVQKSSTVQRWTIVGNNIVLLNEQGKQTAVFGIKGNVNAMFKGQKLIAQTKEIPATPVIKINNDELAMNQ